MGHKRRMRKSKMETFSPRGRKKEKAHAQPEISEP
jgi:hypothetical protein